MPDLEVLRRLVRAAAAAVLGVAAMSAHAQPAVTPQLQLCMACHGPQGNSQIPTTPSLAGQPKLFIENQLVLIREGLRDIPQMKGLLDGVKDGEIVAMAEYFAAQKPVPVAGVVKEPVYQRGQALAGRMLCGSCHVPDFSGKQQIPRLAGQHEEFLRQSLREFRDKPGPGRDTIMSASVHGLKDNDLDDLAHFLAHFRN